MEARFISIDTQFLNENENFDYKERKSEIKEEGNSQMNIKDKTQLNQTCFKNKNRDESLLLIQNILSTHLIIMKISGFNSLKFFSGFNLEKPLKLRLTINQQSQKVFQQYFTESDVHQFPIDQSSSLPGDRQQNILQKRQATNKEQKIFNLSKINSNNKHIKKNSDSASKRNSKSQNGQIIQSIKKLQNLIQTIKQEKQFRDSISLKQKKLLSQKQVTPETPPYIVFFMEEMRGLRKDIHDLKNINYQILEESRSISLKGKTKSHNTEFGFSDSQKNNQDLSNFRLPLKNMSTSAKSYLPNNLPRNRTEIQIQNISAESKGNLSERNHLNKIKQSQSLMQIKKINKIKEEYSACINKFKYSLNNKAVKTRRTNQQCVKKQQINNQHSSHFIPTAEFKTHQHQRQNRKIQSTHLSIHSHSQKFNKSLQARNNEKHKSVNTNSYINFPNLIQKTYKPNHQLNTKDGNLRNNLKPVSIIFNGRIHQQQINYENLPKKSYPISQNWPQRLNNFNKKF